MKRRDVLVGTVPVFTAVTAGCMDTSESDAPSSQDDADSPGTNTDTGEPDTTGNDGGTDEVENQSVWGADDVVVSVEQEVDARPEFHDIVQDALAYWETNSGTYAGYDISYEYQPNADDAEIVITLVDEISSCGGHVRETIVGCAPLVKRTRAGTVDVEIEDGFSAEYTRNIVKHELGHTLGLNHSDEPLHIMSDDIEDRIPGYQDRKSVLDSYRTAVERITDGKEHISTAAEYIDVEGWESAEGEGERAVEDFVTASERLAAAIETSKDVEASDAVEICESSKETVEYARKYSETLVAATRAAGRGDREEAQELSEEMESYREQMDWETIVEMSVLADALGIPTQD